ncbi:MAG: lysophospholipase L1-like esterase [Verrucomicrobiales bacterium]|jgi:lysophospholipase L1-like esterase
MADDTETTTKESSSKKRGWGFRIVALALGLLPFFLFEGVLMLGGWGTPDPSDDPFVGFASKRPLFALNEEGSHFTIAPSRRDWFYPAQFTAEKSKDTFRIFCIGASTVAGRPYTVETAFSSWLRLFLEQSDPSRKWEVVNCGGVSYASYRLVPIVEEVLANYAPDLIILYTGHNEFLEDRTYEHIKGLPLAVTKPYELASHLRTFNLMRSAYLRVSGQTSPSIMEARAIMPEEVDALLEHKGGMENYFRDDEWQQGVIDHYRFNLDRMCAQSRKANVPMIVMNPCSNLRDTHPFKSERRSDLTEKEREEAEELLEKAIESLAETEIERAEILYQAALDIDPLHAETHYRFGKLRDLTNDFAPAYDSYVKAKDLDVCPLRMLEPMHEVLKEVVARHGVELIDTRAEVEKIIIPTGIPSNEEFLDHVHPNIGGHQFFAKLLAEKMEAMGFVTLPRPPADDNEPEDSASPRWLRSMGAALHEYVNTLPAGYFAEGNMRLENLRHWARGHSEIEPPVESKRRKPAN